MKWIIHTRGRIRVENLLFRRLWRRAGRVGRGGSPVFTSVPSFAASLLAFVSHLHIYKQVAYNAVHIYKNDNSC